MLHFIGSYSICWMTDLGWRNIFHYQTHAPYLPTVLPKTVISLDIVSEISKVNYYCTKWSEKREEACLEKPQSQSE